MKENESKAETMKVWSRPLITVYGDVDELTQQSKTKQPGSSDDFHVSGISDFP